jgi:capsule polysaccharide export protein KpsE/RkpR
MVKTFYSVVSGNKIELIIQQVDTASDYYEYYKDNLYENADEAYGIYKVLVQAKIKKVKEKISELTKELNELKSSIHESNI